MGRKSRTSFLVARLIWLSGWGLWASEDTQTPLASPSALLLLFFKNYRRIKIAGDPMWLEESHAISKTVWGTSILYEALSPWWAWIWEKLASVCRLLLFLAQIQGFALLRKSHKQPMHQCVQRNGSFPSYHSGRLLRCFFSGCWGVPSKQKGRGSGDLPVSAVALPVVSEFCYYADYILLTSELAWELRRSWGAEEWFCKNAHWQGCKR